MDWSTKLRSELRERALHYAQNHGSMHYTSRGNPPTVLFCETSAATHGNFHAESYRTICATPDWHVRLKKPHPQKDALPADKALDARELDSSNSSDALLMNCFCFPGAAHQILDALKIETGTSSPEFGVKARVPLADGSEDATEIDMRVGSNLFEAKLTEADFTARPKAHVHRYRDLEEIFDVAALPVVNEQYTGYQLIRNVLAAAHHKASLTVLLDQRRPDLLQQWWRVHGCIRSTELRLRCGFRTWQEVAAASPSPLAEYLAEKYGL